MAQNPENIQDIMKKLPKDAKKKIEKTKGELEKIKTQLLKKFNKNIIGITLLPPPEAAGLKVKKATPKGEINLLILVDDTTSKLVKKYELKNKIIKGVKETTSKINDQIKTQVMLLSELWQNCYDQKYDVLRLISLSSPIYDKGMLAALKLSEIHKSMVLQKFERYIVSYVLAGSLVQGKATPESDVDVFIVIDDTDVKRMTRYELKEKLRAIIIGMGIETGEMTGIKNKLNIQVYILTDFWDSIKEANPVIFTFLRDGVPLHDNGIFLPWKQLLKMGKVKPSQEAIDLYMHTGEEIITKVKRKIKEIGMEDTFWAILTPSQAALMLYGVPPPTPRETPEIMRELFVDKEKILEEKYVKILEANIQLRKDIEHGKVKEVNGAQIDEFVKNADDYLKRIKKLFDVIRAKKQIENKNKNYDNVCSSVRDVLKMEGIEKVADKDLLKLFKEKLVDTGNIESKYARKLNEVLTLNKKSKTSKLATIELDKIKKDTYSLLKRLRDYKQMKAIRNLEKSKIRVKYGGKFGEILVLEKNAFIIKEGKGNNKVVQIADFKKGKFTEIKPSSYEEMDEMITKQKPAQKLQIDKKVLTQLEKIFSKDVEILLS